MVCSEGSTFPCVIKLCRFNTVAPDKIFIYTVLYSEWPFKPQGEVNCPAIPPHPGNQTQIENIQPPILV